MTANLLNRTLFKWIGDPQALLVNGRAPGKCNTTLLAPGQNCEASCGLHVQHVRPSTRYRVRIIGATFLSDMVIALEGHNMTLFEVDVGHRTCPPIDSRERTLSQCLYLLSKCTLVSGIQSSSKHQRPHPKPSKLKVSDDG